MTDPWSCWTCRHREGPDGTGTFSCARPIDANLLSLWERRQLQYKTAPHHRYIGTEKQLRGETQNDRQECPTFEPV